MKKWISLLCAAALLLGILSLGIARVYPVYLLMGVAAYLVSLLLCLAGKD